MPQTEHVAAGFLIVRSIGRPEWLSAELLPSTILSASDCLCQQFPGAYSLAWCSASEEERTAEFEKAGIPPALAPTAVEWATSAFSSEFGWPGVFYTLEAALSARTRFLQKTSAITVLGLALPIAHREYFIEEATPPPKKPGFAPMGESGFLECVIRNDALPMGNVLGYEPLSVEHGQLTHSWLCNQLERHCSEQLGIRPQPNGFIHSLDEAERCCREIEREEVGAEPGPWLPWLVQTYAFG